jgi:putative inorganic carbon (HCO3(-)) transporter
MRARVEDLLHYSPAVVFVMAAASGPLPKVAIVLVSLLAAAVLLLRDARARAVAILGALAVSPPLLLATIWHSSKLSFVHRHPLGAVALAAAALVVVIALAVLIHRHPATLGALAVLAMPFRVSIGTAGGTSNLLIPLYLVVGAGSLAAAVPALRGRTVLGGDTGRQPGWLERLLALYLVIYAVQATYSPGAGFQQAVQNMGFFYVPFTLLYAALVRLRWTPRLLRSCVQIVAVLAVVFAGVAFIEYATKTTFLSEKLAEQNQLYVYFVVNSVFFDPNIFGRFLALAMVALATLLLYERPAREQLAVGAVLVALWAALVLSFSRASMVALLVGLAVLAANKWQLTRALVAAAVVVVIGAAAVAISPTTFGINQGFNGVSAGRGSVLSGGVRLFRDRPLWGFGSGSFQAAYRAHHLSSGTLTASHTTAVTIAAEQGLVGELAYLALVLVAIVGLLRGARADPARAAIAAAFVALVVHTELYADFLEDPFTWVLLGIGFALARAPGRAPEPAAEPAVRVAAVPA